MQETLESLQKTRDEISKRYPTLADYVNERYSGNDKQESLSSSEDDSEIVYQNMLTQVSKLTF